MRSFDHAIILRKGHDIVLRNQRRKWEGIHIFPLATFYRCSDVAVTRTVVMIGLAQRLPHLLTRFTHLDVMKS
jgi:hypothetical protein